MKIWLNDAVVPAKEARISPFDHGYLYGLGVFETFRTYNGHPFLLGDHIDRLNDSLREMGIAFHLDEKEALKMVEELQIANGGKDGYFRLNVSAGVREVGLFPEPYEEPTMMLLQKNLPPMTAEKTGQWLETPRNTPETTNRLKSHHYLNNIAGRREVSGSAIEGLFLTAEGFVAEGVTSNLFWIDNDILYTPALSTGILAGVTRKMVMAIARDSGLHVKEGFYQKESVSQADEVFVTNSVQEIVPITAIGDHSFKGSEGLWTITLQKQYQSTVRSLFRVEDRLN